MPSNRTPADREPAPDHEGQGAGSVVIGLDEVSRSFQRVRESVVRMAPVVQRTAQEMSRALAGVRADPPMSEYDAGDAMRWSPPVDGGEETPSCPA